MSATPPPNNVHYLMPPVVTGKNQTFIIIIMSCQATHITATQHVSVVFYSDATLSASQARATLTRMSSALAVQTKGVGASLCCSM